LVFNHFVPEMRAADLRGLISPLLDFSLKSPVQAYADTLPPKLKSAVLNHEVLVGMSRDMVIRTLGQPDRRVRENDGNVPFEEWIYGDPPHEVQFVRFNGSRVIRLEIADVGQEPIIRDKDETDGYFEGQFVHQVRLGDALPTPAGQERAPRDAPTLRQPGEKLPDVVDQQNQLKKVQFPPDEAKPDAVPASSSQKPAPAANPGQSSVPGPTPNASQPDADSDGPSQTPQ
jgi:hypothetical protein